MSDAKSGKVRQREFVLIAGFVFVLLGIGYVLAAQLVYPITGQGTNFSAVGQHISAFYNITVNNTNIAGENITEIVILLNNTGQMINITDGTLNSSFGVGSSTNWSVNVSASNVKVLGGGLVGYVWFNATADSVVRAGNFTVIMTANLTTVYKNLSSVNINDSFTIDYVGKSNASGTNLSQNYIPLHLNISGNQTTLSLRVSLYNSTGEIYRNISVGGAVNNGSGIAYNFSNLTDGTDLPEGTYVLEVIANNSQNDMNNTANRTYILDRTAPTVTLSQDNGSVATSKNQITVTITVSDARAGINTTCDSTTSTAVITGTGTTQTLVESGLACGTTHIYQITCVDTAGNRNSATSLNTATVSCSGGSSGGSATSGGVAASGGSTSSGSATGSVGNGTSSAVGNAGSVGGAGGAGNGTIVKEPISATGSKLPVAWIVIVAVLVIVAIVYVVMSRKSVAK